MIARHGFVSAWFGLRTRSLGSGGRRMGCSFVAVPFGGMVTDFGRCKDAEKLNEWLQLNESCAGNIDCCLAVLE
jgi:hypothetical protein